MQIRPHTNENDSSDSNNDIPITYTSPYSRMSIVLRPVVQKSSHFQKVAAFREEETMTSCRSEWKLSGTRKNRSFRRKSGRFLKGRIRKKCLKPRKSMNMKDTTEMRRQVFQLQWKWDLNYRKSCRKTRLSWMTMVCSVTFCSWLFFSLWWRCQWPITWDEINDTGFWCTIIDALFAVYFTLLCHIRIMR